VSVNVKKERTPGMNTYVQLWWYIAWVLLTM